MRVRIALLGLFVISVATFMIAPPAGAQAGSLTFDPPSVIAGGGKLFINGKCEANTSGFVISHALAFQPSVGEFAGVPAIAITTGPDGTFGIGLTIDPRVTVGVYSVSLRCGGGLAATGTLTVHGTVLPHTGAPTRGLATAGGVFVAFGASLVALSRRRRRAVARV
jgi:LPXTG-motif cell wall-anchored protein